MRRYSLVLGIDDQLLRDLLSEEIVVHPSGISPVHQQNLGCFTTERRGPDFGVFLQPRWASDARAIGVVHDRVREVI